MNLNKMNFTKQVTNNRDKGISVVQFYNADESPSKKSKGQFEKFSLEHQSMMRVGAVDCASQAPLCKKEGVEGELPRYRVYPPSPIPAQDYMPEGEVDTDKLKKMAYRYVTNRAIDVTSENHDQFKSGNVGTPKIILFTESKGKKPPVIYQALSSHFDKTLEFGYARSTDTALVKKYKIKSYPAFFMLKGNEAPKLYDGEDFTYQHLFDFINIYSETFVFGGTEAVIESGATKAWLSERIPFLSKDSGNDVCFSKDGTLCVLYVTPCRHSVDQAVIDELTAVKDDFVSKVTKGI
jgi:hypothetical protein